MIIEVHVQIDPLMGVTTRCYRLLLTGVGGSFGKILCERLPKYADSLRLSNMPNLGETHTGREIVPCNLADAEAVDTPVAGMGATVHLDGMSIERPLEEALPTSIAGTCDLYEAARHHGVCRVVSASSNHTIGFYKQNGIIDSVMPTKSDGYYGLDKVFGEQLTGFYFDHYGIEAIAIRIGSSFAEAKDHRMLVTWLRYDDPEQLIRRALFVSNVDFTVVHGMLNNHDRWWDNHHVAHLGYTPTQTGKIFRARVKAQPPLPVGDLAAQYQGGTFIKAGSFRD